jgi:hypothetical protein
MTYSDNLNIWKHQFFLVKQEHTLRIIYSINFAVSGVYDTLYFMYYENNIILRDNNIGMTLNSLFR